MIQADFSQIEQEITRWDGRRRLQALLVWGPRGLIAGLCVALILAIISRFRPFLTNSEIGYAALICGTSDHAPKLMDGRSGATGWTNGLPK